MCVCVCVCACVHVCVCVYVCVCVCVCVCCVHANRIEHSIIILVSAYSFIVGTQSLHKYFLCHTVMRLIFSLLWLSSD